MKRSSLLAGLFALTLSTAGHTAKPSKHIHEDIDPYSGERTLTLEIGTDRCTAEASPVANKAYVVLLLSATGIQGQGAAFAMSVDLAYGHTVRTGHYALLDTSTDGVSAQLYPLAQKTKWTERNAFTGNRHVHQLLPFGVSRDYLDSLANAKTFQFRVSAGDATLERCVRARELHDLREFLGQAATL